MGVWNGREGGKSQELQIMKVEVQVHMGKEFLDFYLFSKLDR